MNIVEIHNEIRNRPFDKAIENILSISQGCPEKTMQHIINVKLINDLYRDEINSGIPFLKLYNTHFFADQMGIGKKELPALKEQVLGLIDSMKSFVMSGFKLVEPEEQKRRLDICASCEFITDNFRCTKCGCFMSVKTKIQSVKCLAEKW